MSSFQPPSKELFTGVLHKCGAKVKSWNKRWMVLRSDYCLYYYKDAAKKPLGSISLRDQKFRTRKGEKGDCTWPKNVTMEQTIVMVTSTRTYYMFAEKAKEAEEWKKVLQDSHDQLRDETYRNNRLLSGGPSSASSLSENSREGEERDKTNTYGEGSASPEGDSVFVPQDYLIARKSDEIEGIKFSLGTTLPLQNGVSGQGRGEVENGCIDAIYDLAKQDETPPMDVYEDMDISSQNAPVDVSSPTYEDMDAGGGVNSVQNPSFPESDEYEMITVESMQDSIVPTSAKNQPLPPPPIGGKESTNAVSGLPLYEDIPDTVSSQIQQPFYEDMCDNTNKWISDRRECVPEAQDSGDEDEGREAPPLPPKDDAPPLPPKSSKETDSARASPLTDNKPIPPMNVTPPSPHRQPNISPPSSHRQANVTPSSPHRQANVTPPSPHRQANVTPPSPHRQANVTQPSPNRQANVTPTSPHRQANIPPPSPHNLPPKASPPSPHKRRNVSPPSPHRTTVTPPPITDRDICITPPPHRGGNVTPPSPRRRHNFSPQNLTPHTPQQETKPAVPRPLSSSQERPSTPSPSPKPIPKPRSHSCSSPSHLSDGTSLPSQSLPPKMPLIEVMRVSPEDQAIYDDVCFEPETESYWNNERLKGTKLFCL